MIARSYDPKKLNYLVNHESIRPFVGGDITQPLDLSAALENPENVFLANEHGGFFFTWTAPDTYEVHTFILPEGRGQGAVDLALEARDWMELHGADHIWTRVPKGRENVRRLTVAAGFSPCGEQVLDLGGGPEAFDLYQWRL